MSSGSVMVNSEKRPGSLRSDTRPGVRFVDLVETFENALLLVLRNADAGVADREAETPLATLQGDADDAAVGRELEGVGEQVREHHFEEHPIDGQRLAFQLRAEDIVHVAVLGHLLEHREDLGDDGIDILHGDLHLEHLQLGLAVVQQLVDDVQQFEAVAVATYLSAVPCSRISCKGESISVSGVRSSCERLM